ncbi:MAG TPA: hypothetical protein VJ063_19760 [Verrucomicrobiae bacterium]|nr:hypothetical protein [Verrucomicrobiae bacterium]
MKRLFAVLLALAVMWPQVILPFPAKQPACTNCKCPMVCCGSEAAQSEPLAAPAPNVFAPIQWSVPQQAVLFYLPWQERTTAGYSNVELFPSTIPLFLRNCVQLI